LTSGPRPDCATLLSTPLRPASPPHCSSTGPRRDLSLAPDGSPEPSPPPNSTGATVACPAPLTTAA
jgi:hypothetical protein